MAGRARKAKDEFPPLLAAGMHPLSVDDLKDLVLDSFPLSQRRPTLWANLMTLVDQLEQLQIKCRVWVDGSFLTEKIDPDDIDIVVEIDVATLHSPNSAQMALITAIDQQAFYCNEKLDTYIIPDAPVVHNMYAIAQLARAQWERDFGHAFISGDPKGIAILEVSP